MTVVQSQIVVLQFVLVASALLLSNVLAASPTSRNPFTHELTGVSGFGARSQKKTIFPVNITDPTSPKTDRSLGVEFDNSVLKPDVPTRLFATMTRDPDVLWLQVRDGNSTQTTTLRLSVDKKTGDWKAEETSVKKKVAKQEWIPIEGIYGMYRVPSGIIWVLVTKTEHVYSAPPLETSDSWWKIRRVSNLELVHLSRPGALLTTSHLKEEIRQLRLLRQALKYHDFYFVPNDSALVTDMTKKLQDSLDVDRESNEQWWETAKRRPDPRFFWNQAAVQPLLPKLNESDSAPHDQIAPVSLLQNILPLTSAFVGVKQNLTVGDGTKMMYDQLLISRRSKFRAGTRFTRRGADAVGSVANYAETEQISLILSNETYTLHQIMSHVQIRGSLPLRWSSPADVKTYRPRVRIGTDPLAQARALRLHLLEQHAHYGRSNSSLGSSKNAEIVFVNLIDKHSDQGRLGRAFDAVLNAVVEVHSNQTEPDSTTEEANTKKSQRRLSRAFDAVFKAIVESPSNETELDSATDLANTSETKKKQGSPSVEHVWYDFHAEVKGGQWQKLGSLLKDLQPALIEHGFFHADVAPGGMRNPIQVQRRQIGAVRTNCMDCLDRTNVVQSMLGRYMLFQQLSTASDGFIQGKDSNKKWVEYDLAFRNNQLTLPWPEGETAHRPLWADNADAISRLYAGTPALKRDFTRTGKRTKRGALDDGMNSLQRYYLNNFLDADRQEGMDLLVGYANFSNVDFLEEDYVFDSDVGEASLSEAADQKALLSIQEAARKTFFGDLLDGLNDHDKDEAQQRLAEIGIRGGTRVGRKSLDFRWLPGDLQSHVISQASSQGSTSRRHKVDETSEFSSSKALEAIDRRSASTYPWWAELGENTESDTDDETNAGDGGKSKTRASVDVQAKLVGSNLPLTQHEQQHKPLTPMQLLGVVVLASKAPMSLAGILIALLTLTLLPQII